MCFLIAHTCSAPGMAAEIVSSSGRPVGRTRHKCCLGQAAAEAFVDGVVRSHSAADCSPSQPSCGRPSARFANQIPGGNAHVEQNRKSNHWLCSASPYLTNMAKRGLQWPRRLKECWCFQQRMPARAIGLMPPLRLCSVLQCRLSMWLHRFCPSTVDNARL